MSGEARELEGGASQRDSSSDTRIVMVISLVALGFAVLLLFLFTDWNQVTPPELDLIDVSTEVATAVTQDRELVLANPNSAQAWGQLANSLRAHEFGPESEICYQQAELLDPQNSHWPYLLGVSRTYTDVEGAKACYRRAIAIEPEFKLARLRLAELLLDQDKLDEAERQLSEVLRRTPEDPRAQLGLAQAAWLNGNVEESRRWAERSAALQRGQRATHELLSRIYYRLKDPPAAQRQLDILNTLPEGKTNWDDPIVADVLRLRRDAEFVTQNAQALFDSGQKQVAIAEMQRNVQRHPDGLEFRAELGRMLFLADDLPQAAKVLDEAIERHPGTAELFRLRGFVYLRQGQLQPAAACFREAIQHKPGHAEAYDSLGQCLTEMQDTRGAIDAFRDAIRYDPTLAGAHANLGRLLLDQGQQLDGIKHLELAVELYPDDPRVKQAKKLLEAARQMKNRN